MDSDLGSDLGMGKDSDLGSDLGMGKDTDKGTGKGMGTGMGKDRDIELGMGTDKGKGKDMGMGKDSELGMGKDKGKDTGMGRGKGRRSTKLMSQWLKYHWAKWPLLYMCKTSRPRWLPMCLIRKSTVQLQRGQVLCSMYK